MFKIMIPSPWSFFEVFRNHIISSPLSFYLMFKIMIPSPLLFHVMLKMMILRRSLSFFAVFSNYRNLMSFVVNLIFLRL